MFSLKRIFLIIISLGVLIIAYAYFTRIGEERLKIDDARSTLAASNQLVIPARYTDDNTDKILEIIPNYTYSAIYSSSQKEERLKMWDDLLERTYAQISCTGNGCIEYVLSASCNNKATTTIFLKREGGDDDIKLYIDIERARAREFHLEYEC